MHQALPGPNHDDVGADCPRCGRECEVWAVEPTVVLNCDHCQEVFHVGVTWADMDETDHLEGD